MGDVIMAQVRKPNKAISIRSIQPTESDRKQHSKEFREQKKHEQQLKEERFAKIAERRKNKKSGPGRGGGINIEIKGE